MTTATAVVAAAKAKLETAKTDAATKQSAEDVDCSATFKVAPLSLTGVKSDIYRIQCVGHSKEANYIAIDAACTSTITASTKADQALVAVNTKVTGTEASLATIVAEASGLMNRCLCRVRKS